jgi:hypothetical protein
MSPNFVNAFCNTSELFAGAQAYSGLYLILPSYAAVNLGRALFPIFALALNLPEDFFKDKVHFYPCLIFTRLVHRMSYQLQTQHSAALMKLLYYPPQTGPVDERVIGIGAHTEYVLVLHTISFSSFTFHRNQSYKSWEARTL